MNLDNCEIRLKQFETYRKEDQHECTLLSQRVAAFLVSQSFLVIATTAVYSSTSDKGPKIATFIAMFAVVLALIASIAIAIGCRVLRRWHEFGTKLLAADAQDGYLKGFHFNRRQADLAHILSMDVFNIAIPIAFLTGWMYVVGRLHPEYVFWLLLIWAGDLVFVFLIARTFKVGEINDHDFHLSPPAPSA